MQRAPHVVMPVDAYMLDVLRCVSVMVADLPFFPLGLDTHDKSRRAFEVQMD